MLGVGLYANSILAAFTRFAGLENDYNWTWALDYAEDKPIKVDLDIEKIKWYIDMLEKTSSHPFISRIFRSWRRQKNDPFYYFLQD